jgi:hypothetical protein
LAGQSRFDPLACTVHESSILTGGSDFQCLSVIPLVGTRANPDYDPEWARAFWKLAFYVVAYGLGFATVAAMAWGHSQHISTTESTCSPPPWFGGLRDGT